MKRSPKQRTGPAATGAKDGTPASFRSPRRPCLWEPRPRRARLGAPDGRNVSHEDVPNDTAPERGQHPEQHRSNRSDPERELPPRSPRWARRRTCRRDRGPSGAYPKV